MNFCKTPAEFSIIHVHLLSNVWTKSNKWFVKIIESLRPLIKCVTTNTSQRITANTLQ